MYPMATRLCQTAIVAVLAIRTLIAIPELCFVAVLLGFRVCIAGYLCGRRQLTVRPWRHGCRAYPRNPWSGRYLKTFPSALAFPLHIALNSFAAPDLVLRLEGLHV